MAKPDLANYVTVAERIEKFYAEHSEGSLQAEIVHDDGKRVVMKAYAYRSPDDSLPGIGHAEEIRGDGPINKTSALENCETSAVGRALAMLGLEVKKGIASREEVEQAIAEEQRQETDQQNGKRQSDKWVKAMIEQVGALGLVEEAKMKLTSMRVERLVEMTDEQAQVFQEWLKAQPDKVAA